MKWVIRKVGGLWLVFDGVYFHPFKDWDTAFRFAELHQKDFIWPPVVDKEHGLSAGHIRHA